MLNGINGQNNLLRNGIETSRRGKKTKNFQKDFNMRAKMVYYNINPLKLDKFLKLGE
jgi:hypothetical protein